MLGKRLVLGYVCLFFENHLLYIRNAEFLLKLPSAFLLLFHLRYMDLILFISHKFRLDSILVRLSLYWLNLVEIRHRLQIYY